MHELDYSQCVIYILLIWMYVCVHVCVCVCVCVYFFFFASFRKHPWHIEVPRLGGKSELQLPNYTRAIAAWDLSRIFNLHHSSGQFQIPNPLREDKDGTHILMDTSQIRFHWTTAGIPWMYTSLKIFFLEIF